MTDCCKDDDKSSATDGTDVATSLARIERKLDNHSGVLASIVSNIAWIVGTVQQTVEGMSKMPGIGGMMRKAVK